MAQGRQRRVVRGGGSNGRAGRTPAGLIGALLASTLLFGALGTYLGLRRTETPAPRPSASPKALLTPALVSPPPASPETLPASTNTLLISGTQSVPVIMYHDVVKRRQVWFDLTTSEFRQQMEDLAAAGAHPVSLADLYDHLQSGKPLPEHAIVLTFDDCTLGHFTEALPVLKEHGFSAVFFVQTASVGVTTEKKHMDWDQLKQAEATGLISVESHTVTHPEDITTLSDTVLDTEMQSSKQTLEAHLGHPIRFLAYPSGHCDARVAKAAQNAGYLAAVTMDRGWVGSPAQSFYLPRFTPKRVPEVMAVWRGEAQEQPPMPRLIPVKADPLTWGSYTSEGTTIQWIAGGDLGTQALATRRTVGELAKENHAQAALNGTFFADARVDSKGSAMIGPTLCRVDAHYAPSEPSEDSRIEGRPLILVGEGTCIALPYTAHLGHSREALQDLMPDLKDAFLAGGWIVHDGKAVLPQVMKVWSTSDAGDPRHRAFAGIDPQGRYMLGATQDSVSTQALAVCLEKMGAKEAWLMDSGFSTSLIWENHVLVSGHFHKDVPSRPVPHALFLFGDPAQDAPAAPADTPLASGEGAATLADALAADSGVGAARVHVRHHRRKRHHPHHAVAAATPAAPASASGPPVDSGSGSVQ